MSVFSQHKLMSLSFAVATPTRVDLWPAAAGTAERQHAEGRRRADEVLDYVQANDAPMVLDHVINAIGRQTRSGPLEDGFTGRIAELDHSGCITPVAAPVLRLIVDNG